jgi:hypothetical protein
MLKLAPFNALESEADPCNTQHSVRTQRKPTRPNYQHAFVNFVQRNNRCYHYHLLIKFVSFLLFTD